MSDSTDEAMEKAREIADGWFGDHGGIPRDCRDDFVADLATKLRFAEAAGFRRGVEAATEYCKREHYLVLAKYMRRILLPEETSDG